MAEDDRTGKLAKIAFEETLRRRQQEAAASLLRVPDGSIDELISKFEKAAHYDEDGSQYWFARDLQELLEYSKWDNFLAVVAKAREACDRSGNPISDHFADVGKMVPQDRGQCARLRTSSSAGTPPT